MISSCYKLGVLVLPLMIGVSVAAPPRYAMTDIGVLDGTNVSDAFAISNAGHVVGVAYQLQPTGNWRVFVWQKGKIHDQGNFGKADRTKMRVGGINDHGQWAGSAEVIRIDPAAMHAILGHEGKLTELASPAKTIWSGAVTINNHGEIAGTAFRTAGGGNLATCWKMDGPHLLGEGMLPGGSYGSAVDINDHGQVVGISKNKEGKIHAFLWDGKVMQDLGTLKESSASSAAAINNLGDIVGTSQTATRDVKHAVLWSGGKIIDLGALPGDRSSAALDINLHGQVVGSADVASIARRTYADLVTGIGSTHAVTWIDKKIIDLNDCIPADSGWDLLTARGINDKGQIIGTGRIGGNLRACLITPVKEVRDFP